MQDQGPGINPGDAHQFVTLHEVLKGIFRQQVGIPWREIPDHHAGYHRRRCFIVDIHGAVIPDMGIRHHHDLAVIGWIGEDLLVSGHRGIEAQLTARLTSETDRFSGDDGPIGEGQFAGRRLLKQLVVCWIRHDGVWTKVDSASD